MHLPPARSSSLAGIIKEAVAGKSNKIFKFILVYTSKLQFMPQELPPPVQLMQMLFGFAVSRAIGVAAELCIADLIKDAPKTAQDLAQQTDAHARSLYRLLRTCASIGVFSEDSENRFSLTLLAEPLLSDAPG